MIKKYSKESMEELGSYVYIFSKDGDVLKALQEGQQFQYGGKGVDKRTLTHTLSEEAGGKGYSQVSQADSADAVADTAGAATSTSVMMLVQYMWRQHNTHARDSS